jgi:hypothetical protein
VLLWDLKYDNSGSHVVQWHYEGDVIFSPASQGTGAQVGVEGQLSPSVQVAFLNTQISDLGQTVCAQDVSLSGTQIWPYPTVPLPLMSSNSQWCSCGQNKVHLGTVELPATRQTRLTPYSLKKTKFRDFSPRANYTDRATASCRRS